MIVVIMKMLVLSAIVSEYFSTVVTAYKFIVYIECCNHKHLFFVFFHYYTVSFNLLASVTKSLGFAPDLLKFCWFYFVLKLLFKLFVTEFVKRYLFHTFDTPENKML